MWQTSNITSGGASYSTVTISGVTSSSAITFVGGTGSYVTVGVGNSLSSSLSTSTYAFSIYDGLIEYMDMIAKLSGIPIDYYKYNEMTEGEKEAFIRLQKIKKIEE